jgi:putative IMPACT (imprinted ancient) family translation regulator
VRGSRFIGVAYPARTEAEARAVLEAREREYFDASHHCAAWRFRDATWRALDAGEPSGSAGAPILAAIDAADLLDVAVVVTRYFGGTKLGVGGLARSYGDAAAAALDQAPRRRGIPAVRLRVPYGYEQTAAVMRALERFAARDVRHGFGAGEHPEAEVIFILAAEAVTGFRESLREMSAGRLGAEEVATTVFYVPAAGEGPAAGADWNRDRHSDR